VIYSVQTKPKDAEYYMKKCIKLSGRICEKMSEKIGEKHEIFKERHLFLRQRIRRNKMPRKIKLELTEPQVLQLEYAISEYQLGLDWYTEKKEINILDRITQKIIEACES